MAVGMWRTERTGGGVSESGAGWLLREEDGGKIVEAIST